MNSLSLNVHEQLSSGVTDLIFGQDRHFCPYSMKMSSEGSCETAQMGDFCCASSYWPHHNKT